MVCTHVLQTAPSHYFITPFLSITSNSIEEWSNSEPRIRNYSLNHNTIYYDEYSNTLAHNVSLIRGQDLLAAYDQGMNLVRQWKFDE